MEVEWSPPGLLMARQTLSSLNAGLLFEAGQLNLLLDLGFDHSTAQNALERLGVCLFPDLAEYLEEAAEGAAAEEEEEEAGEESVVVLEEELHLAPDSSPEDEEEEPPTVVHRKRRRSPRPVSGAVQPREERRKGKKEVARKKSKVSAEEAAAQEAQIVKSLLGRPDLHMLAMFWKYVHERQMVWFRRDRGDPEPWTEDVALQSYFFCNVYRELDAGGVYFKQQVALRREANPQLEFKEIVFMAVAYRLINNAPTFQRYAEMGIPISSEMTPWLRWLRKEMDAKRQVFTGAHQNNGLRRYEKTLTQLSRTLDRYSEAVRESSSVEQCYANLKTLFGMGSFFAWQVCCDLQELNLLSFSEYDDWVAVGPSAIIGLRFLYPDIQKPVQSVLLELVRDLWERQQHYFKQYDLDFVQWSGRKLSMKNIEHSLCEFGKYAKAVTGCGTSQKLRKRQSSIVCSDK